jgi:hypothetical protein
MPIAAGWAGATMGPLRLAMHSCIQQRLHSTSVQRAHLNVRIFAKYADRRIVRDRVGLLYFSGRRSVDDWSRDGGAGQRQ